MASTNNTKYDVNVLRICAIFLCLACAIVYVISTVTDVSQSSMAAFRTAFTNKGENKSTNNILQSGDCSAYTHIHYIKVPKTGSSTMSNILHRVITKHSLNISPSGGYNGCSQIFKENPQKNTKFDIHTSHQRYNETIIFHCLHADTKIITMIREPYSQMKSRLRFSGILKKDTTIAKIIAHEKFKEPVTANFFNINVRKAVENGVFLQEELEYRKLRYELVMIAGRYDESLVLLKRRMCWTIKQILHLQLKRQVYPDTTDLDSEKVRKLHRTQAAIEYTIYDFFYKIFDEAVSLEDSFEAEVALYRRIKAKVTGFCNEVMCAVLQENTSLAMRQPLSSSVRIAASPFNSAFVVSGSDCLLMSLKLKCYKPMLWVQALERLSIPLGSVKGRLREDYSSKQKDRFMVENMPYDMVSSCSEATFTCLGQGVLMQ